MDNPHIEIANADPSSVSEVAVSAPWKTSIKLHLTLKNASSAVMIPTDLFNSLATHQRIKWTLHDAAASLEIKVTLFDPQGTFSENAGDVETGKTLLQPDKPLEVWLSPFSFRYDASASSLDAESTYHIRLESGTVPSNATEAKTFLDLARLRRENQPLFSPEASELPVTLSSPLSFRTVSTNSPWIEVRSFPSHKEFKSGYNEEFKIRLQITLRNSEDSILVDSGPGSVLFSRDTMLQQGGGLLGFVDVQNHVRIRRPQMFIQQAKGQWNVGTLMQNTTTLAPDTSIDVYHTVFKPGTSAEEMEKEGFAVGREYDIELRQHCRIKRWVRGGKTGHAFQKLFSGDWSGEPEWEGDAIPVGQRDLVGKSVFKIV